MDIIEALVWIAVAFIGVSISLLVVFYIILPTMADINEFIFYSGYEQDN